MGIELLLSDVTYKIHENSSTCDLRKSRDSCLPRSRRAAMCSGHSALSLSAPVRLPSPPQTTRASIPCRTKLRAAVRRPSISRNSAHRAVPIRVPPILANPRTSSHPTCALQDQRTAHVAQPTIGECTHSEDVSSLESLFTFSLLEQLTLSVRRNETALPPVGKRVLARERCTRMRFDRSCLSVFIVSSNEAFPSLSNDISFTATVGSSKRRAKSVSRSASPRGLASPILGFPIFLDWSRST